LIDYAKLLSTELAAALLDRVLLAVLAKLVQATGVGPTADLGCSSGRMTTHLRSLELSICGADLPPAMVAVARRRTRAPGWTRG
jgi:predicted TPR repeat methyltransferase